MPYLKRKLDDAYEIHSGGAATSLFGAAYRTGVEADEDVSPRRLFLFMMVALCSPTVSGLTKRKVNIPTKKGTARGIPGSERSVLPISLSIQFGLSLR